MEGEKEGKTEGAGKGGVASLPGTSTQLLTIDDGSKRAKQGQKTKKRVEKITKGDKARHCGLKKQSEVVCGVWEKNRDGQKNRTGTGSVSDRRGGPPTQRVSGHPWRVRAQES